MTQCQKKLLKHHRTTFINDSDETDEELPNDPNSSISKNLKSIASQTVDPKAIMRSQYLRNIAALSKESTSATSSETPSTSQKSDSTKQNGFCSTSGSQMKSSATSQAPSTSQKSDNTKQNGLCSASGSQMKSSTPSEAPSTSQKGKDDHTKQNGFCSASGSQESQSQSQTQSYRTGFYDVEEQVEMINFVIDNHRISSCCSIYTWQLMAREKSRRHPQSLLKQFKEVIAPNIARFLKTMHRIGEPRLLDKFRKALEQAQIIEVPLSAVLSPSAVSLARTLSSSSADSSKVEAASAKLQKSIAAKEPKTPRSSASRKSLDGTVISDSEEETDTKDTRLIKVPPLFNGSAGQRPVAKESSLAEIKKSAPVTSDIRVTKELGKSADAVSTPSIVPKTEPEEEEDDVVFIEAVPWSDEIDLVEVKLLIETSDESDAETVILPPVRNRRKDEINRRMESVEEESRTEVNGDGESPNCLRVEQKKGNSPSVSVNVGENHPPEIKEERIEESHLVDSRAEIPPRTQRKLRNESQNSTSRTTPIEARYSRRKKNVEQQKPVDPPDDDSGSDDPQITIALKMTDPSKSAPKVTDSSKNASKITDPSTNVLDEKELIIEEDPSPAPANPEWRLSQIDRKLFQECRVLVERLILEDPKKPPATPKQKRKLRNSAPEGTPSLLRFGFRRSLLKSPRASNPVKVEESPAKSLRSPAKSLRSPVKSSTSAKSSTTPVKFSRTPVESSRTPVESSRTPLESSRTPVESSTSPAKPPQRFPKIRIIEEAAASRLDRDPVPSTSGGILGHGFRASEYNHLSRQYDSDSSSDTGFIQTKRPPPVPPRVTRNVSLSRGTQLPPYLIEENSLDRVQEWILQQVEAQSAILDDQFDSTDPDDEETQFPPVRETRSKASKRKNSGINAKNSGKGSHPAAGSAAHSKPPVPKKKRKKADDADSKGSNPTRTTKKRRQETDSDDDSDANSESLNSSRKLKRAQPADLDEVVGPTDSDDEETQFPPLRETRSRFFDKRKNSEKIAKNPRKGARVVDSESPIAIKRKSKRRKVADSDDPDSKSPNSIKTAEKKEETDSDDEIQILEVRKTKENPVQQKKQKKQKKLASPKAKAQKGPKKADKTAAKSSKFTVSSKKRARKRKKADESGSDDENSRSRRKVKKETEKSDTDDSSDNDSDDASGSSGTSPYRSIRMWERMYGPVTVEHRETGARIQFDEDFHMDPPKIPPESEFCKELLKALYRDWKRERNLGKKALFMDLAILHYFICQPQKIRNCFGKPVIRHMLRQKWKILAKKTFEGVRTRFRNYIMGYFTEFGLPKAIYNEFLYWEWQRDLVGSPKKEKKRAKTRHPDHDEEETDNDDADSDSDADSQSAESSREKEAQSVNSAEVIDIITLSSDDEPQKSPKQKSPDKKSPKRKAKGNRKGANAVSTHFKAPESTKSGPKKGKSADNDDDDHKSPDSAKFMIKKRKETDDNDDENDDNDDKNDDNDDNDNKNDDNDDNDDENDDNDDDNDDNDANSTSSEDSRKEIKVKISDSPEESDLSESSHSDDDENQSPVVKKMRGKANVQENAKKNKGKAEEKMKKSVKVHDRSKSSVLTRRKQETKREKDDSDESDHQSSSSSSSSDDDDNSAASSESPFRSIRMWERMYGPITVEKREKRKRITFEQDSITKKKKTPPNSEFSRELLDALHHDLRYNIRRGGHFIVEDLAVLHYFICRPRDIRNSSRREVFRRICDLKWKIFHDKKGETLYHRFYAYIRGYIDKFGLPKEILDEFLYWEMNLQRRNKGRRRRKY